MEEHGDDSSTRGVADSMDPMDIDCVTASGSSEAVGDGFQESSSMQSKSSHASVSQTCKFSYLFIFIVHISCQKN